MKFALRLLIVITIVFALRQMLIQNVTASEPLGFYLATPYFSTPRYGDVVVACEPANAHAYAAAHGFNAVNRTFPIDGCPEDRILFKTVWGIAGDSMRVIRSGVVRNGIPLPDSAPLAAAGDGTPVPTAAPTIVPPHQIWAGSPVRGSFDSRYFGPVPLVARATLIPDWLAAVITIAAAALCITLLYPYRARVIPQAAAKSPTE